VDGGDCPSRIQPGPYVICRREATGFDFGIPLPMSLPEEIFNWITSFDNVSKRYSVGFLGSLDGLYDERRIVVEKVAELYPDSLLQTSEVPSSVNRNPIGRVSRKDYYQALQKCKAVLTLRGLGFDTFRFWENAACKAVHLSQRMPLLIPNDFEDGKEILRFSSLYELRRLIEFALSGGNKSRVDEIIQHSRINLFRHHLTTRRAAYLSDRLAGIYG
jgi:hypothetical protein